MLIGKAEQSDVTCCLVRWLSIGATLQLCFISTRVCSDRVLRLLIYGVLTYNELIINKIKQFIYHHSISLKHVIRSNVIWFPIRFSVWHPMVHPIINGQFCLFINSFCSLNGYSNFLFLFLSPFEHFFNIHVTLNYFSPVTYVWAISVIGRPALQSARAKTPLELSSVIITFRFHSRVQQVCKANGTQINFQLSTLKTFQKIHVQ